jgi:subtilase family serine protease
MGFLRGSFIVGGACAAIVFAACTDDPSVDTNTSALTGPLPDLIEINVSVPSTSPLNTNVGGTLSISDTAQNQGSASAAASITKYVLSPDGTTKVGQALGSRAVGTLAVAGTDSGTANLTVQNNTADGDYFVLACADSPGAIAESNESNNCTIATANGSGQLTLHIASPDLIVSAISEPPPTSEIGVGFMVTDTTANQGSGAAVPSETDYFLSTNGTAKTKQIGFRSVGSLAADDAGTPGTATVTIPANTATGSYFLLACADQRLQVAESNESNNCKASMTMTAVTGPDLVETDVSVAPTTLTSSDTLNVTETAQNTGDADAGASGVRLFASLDTVKDASDLLIIPGCAGGTSILRDVPALVAGATSMATTGTKLCYKETGTGILKPLPLGTWYIISCGDAANVVVETSETNNCTTSATSFMITTEGGTKPDLVETSVTVPLNGPQTMQAGSTFTINDSAVNETSVAAGSSITRAYLSLDGTTKVGPFLSTRTVGALAGGASSVGSATATIPVGMADGDYFVVTCADALFTVSETNETNNCLTANDGNGAELVIQLGSPDLVISTIANPPSTIQVGGTFTASSGTTNQGNGAAGASTTRYFLSTNGIAKTGTLQEQAINAFPSGMPGSTQNTMTTISIPTIASGSYYLLACADVKNVVAESNENNNCLASALQVVVSGPDLVETGLSFMPSSVATGGSLNVTEAEQNIGDAAAGTTHLRSYASTDMVKDATDFLILPNCATADLRVVGTLAPGASSPGLTTARLCYRDSGTGTIKSIPAGVYYLIVCADGAGNILETNEANNCLSTASQFTITP